MLKPKVIHQILEQTLIPGMKSSILMTMDGSLLAFAGGSEKEVATYATVGSNAWTTFSRFQPIHSKEEEQKQVGEEGKENSHIKSVVIRFEEACTCIGAVGKFLICLVSDEEEVPVGMLRLKTIALQEHLNEQLKSLQH